MLAVVVALVVVVAVVVVVVVAVVVAVAVAVVAVGSENISTLLPAARCQPCFFCTLMLLAAW